MKVVRGLTAPLSARKFRNGSRGKTLCCGVSGGWEYRPSIQTSCLPAVVAGHVRRTNKMREIITLQCPDCKNRNYSTTKNKKTTTGRLEFSKFCNTCRKHTAHKETK
jgi:large subunit ribosomal protein L33